MRPLPKKHKCTECDRSHYDKEADAILAEHFTACAGCTKPVYYQYVVKDEVWAQTGLEYHGGVLHIECLEQLIGRPLDQDDFRGAIGSKAQGQSINDLILWAWKKGEELEWATEVSTPNDMAALRADGRVLRKNMHDRLKRLQPKSD